MLWLQELTLANTSKTLPATLTNVVLQAGMSLLKGGWVKVRKQGNIWNFFCFTLFFFFFFFWANTAKTIFKSIMLLHVWLCKYCSTYALKTLVQRPHGPTNTGLFLQITESGHSSEITWWSLLYGWPRKDSRPQSRAMNSLRPVTSLDGGCLCYS